MCQANQSDANPVPRGAEQRAFPRYPIRLSAVLKPPHDAGLMDCEIRDFCVSGMYLVYEPAADAPAPPKVGDTVEIGCSIPDTVGKHSLQFLARVVRATGDSAGVALLDADVESIQALQGFAAVRAERAVANVQAGAEPADPAQAAMVVNEYRRLVGEAVQPLMHAFLDAVDSRLYELAKHAPDMSSEKLYLGTQGMLKAGGREIKERMGQAMMKKLAEPPAPEPASSAPEETAGGLTLTLMDDADLENWLAVSDLANHIEQGHQAVLAEVERRLSHLHGTPINGGNNPIGPAVFAHAFREAIGPLNLEHSMTMLCFGVFKETLGRDIADLYRKVNELLVDNGILPDLKPAIVHTGGKGPARTTAPAAAAKPPSDAAGEAPAPAPAAPDLYQILSDLRRLQQGLSRTATGQTAVPDTRAAGAGPTFETAEILAALNQLQSQTRGAAPPPSGGNLQAAVMAALTARHPGADKRIGTRERDVMETAGDLFDSLLQDMMVAKCVRAWLQRLKIPLVKLAIRDESLFIDKSHTARQVMNRLAQLELYGEEKGTNAIQRRVDGLLDRIAGQADTDPGVFAKALKDLDMLIKIQNEAYADNVRDVIAQCEQEQSRQGSTAPAEDVLDADETLWRRRARRLRAGQWVLFTSGAGQPQRLKLAWASKARDRYVFVNLRGLQETSLSVAELARGLRDGSAVVLDNADEPAVDRAQHSMLQKLHHQLLHESTHDQLTGLINRREFERRIDAVLSGSSGQQTGHCLCYLDINQLSVINTTCGYGAGDNLLVEISGFLRRIMGNRAVTARLGDDAFGILLPRRSQAEALALVHELMDAVRGYRFEWHDKRFTVSLGIGLVEAGGLDMTAAALLQAAETCCHSAKARGTNQVQVYHADDSEMINRRKIMHWVSRIDKALDEGSLSLRCQPIAALQGNNDHQPHHYEVLLGVTDESGKAISPGEFIAAAERYNRMQAVDRWVIRNVFRWMAQHRDALEGIDGFAINLSGRSLSDDSLAEFIRDEAEKAAVPTDKICFEVTETAGITNLSDATEFILKMKETGCRFSLDDFGSGLSSYAYLKNLPVDYLKIDGAFVKDMHRSPSDFAVVKSICEIGHFMGKQIIAEFVENQNIVERLRDIGVDYAQGHVIGIPRPLEDLAGTVAPAPTQTSPAVTQ